MLTPTSLKAFMSKNKHYIQFAASLGYKVDMTDTEGVSGTDHPLLCQLPYRWKHNQNCSAVARVTVNLEKNTFSFKRGLQFETSSSTLRDDIPTLRRALRKIAPGAKVINESTHVYIDVHEETFPLSEETNE